MQTIYTGFIFIFMHEYQNDDHYYATLSVLGIHLSNCQNIYSENICGPSKYLDHKSIIDKDR